MDKDDGDFCKVLVNQQIHHKFVPINVEINKLFAESGKRLGIDYDAQLSYEFGLFCKDHRSGTGCFYVCQNTSRNVCDWRGNQICTPGWNYGIVIYKLLFYKNASRLKEECIYFDKCHSTVTLCPKSQPDCFTMSNSTVHCISLKPLYKNSAFPKLKNMTSDYLLVNETLSCEFEIVSNNNKMYDWMISYWMPVTDAIGILNIKSEYIRATAKEDPKTDVELMCRLYMRKREKYFMYTRKITVASKPTEVILYNRDDKKYPGTYLGDQVLCDSNSWPRTNFLSLFIILSENFYADPVNSSYTAINKRVVIPPEANLGFFVINCTVTNYFDYKRPALTHTAIFDSFIKSYVNFSWKSYSRDLYWSHEMVSCSFLALIQGKLNIIQQRGPFQLNYTVPEAISLDAESGGSFMLTCYLTFLENDLIFYKTISFDIYKIPTLVCFQIFPRLRGAIMQCNHNGYPLDMANSRVILQEQISDRYIAAVENFNALRIPYLLVATNVVVICNISFQSQIDKSPIYVTKKLAFTVRDGGSDIMDLNQDFMECSKFGKIPNMEDAEGIGNGKVLFYKGIAEFEPNQIPEWFIITFIAVCFFLLYLSFYLTMYLHELIFFDKQQRLTHDYICRVLKAIDSRRLNDNLNRTAKDFINGENQLLFDCFKKHVSQKNSWSITGFTLLHKSLIEKEPSLKSLGIKAQMPMSRGRKSTINIRSSRFFKSFNMGL